MGDALWQPRVRRVTNFPIVAAPEVEARSGYHTIEQFVIDAVQEANGIFVFTAAVAPQDEAVAVIIIDEGEEPQAFSVRVQGRNSESSYRVDSEGITEARFGQFVSELRGRIDDYNAHGAEEGDTQRDEAESDETLPEDRGVLTAKQRQAIERVLGELQRADDEGVLGALAEDERVIVELGREILIRAYRLDSPEGRHALIGGLRAIWRLVQKAKPYAAVAIVEALEAFDVLA